MHRASFLTTAYPHWAALRLDTVTVVEQEQQLLVEVSSTRQSARSRLSVALSSGA